MAPHPVGAERADRPRIFRRRFTRAGAPPGTYSPHEDADPTSIHLASYNADELRERALHAGVDVASTLEADREGGRQAWLDVRGLGDTPTLEALQGALKIHPLVFADVLNIGQRPKVEDYDDALFVIVRMVILDRGEVRWEQVSLLARPGVVMSVQEREGDCLEPLRERLRQNKKTLRAGGSDYLLAMLIDAIVDGYFPIVDQFGERLEELEDAVVDHPRRELLGEIYSVKRGLLAFRRAVWPLREAMSALLRDEHALVTNLSRPYLRDTLDHLAQVADIIETYREMASGLIDIYLSSLANRTNEVMRVLTVLAAVFVPITFLAGVYGMNFDVLPELHWEWGYLVFWLAVLAIAGGMLAFFMKMGWIGRR